MLELIRCPNCQATLGKYIQLYDSLMMLIKQKKIKDDHIFIPSDKPISSYHLSGVQYKTMLDELKLTNNAVVQICYPSL
jgi:hypothetical protein